MSMEKGGTKVERSKNECCCHYSFVILWSLFHNVSILATIATSLLKYGRGPKLEGCAFANFGISSGASRNRTSGV